MGNLQDYGFPFNSVASDRTYNASDWRDYFQALVEGGVVEGLGDGLGVTQQAIADKSVLVGTGFVVVNGAVREVSADITLAIADNASGSTRIDRIVARLDYTSRLIQIAVLVGTPGAGAPALTQNTSIYEISLAQVSLVNGFTTVTDAVITDERTYLTWRALTTHKADFTNPHAVTKTQVGLGSVENYGIATQAEAEAGTSDVKYMTPLKTLQFGDKLVANGFYTASVTFPESSTTTITVPLGGAFTSVSGAVEALHGFSFTVGTTQSQSIFTANSGAMGSRVTIGAIATAYDTVYIDIGVSSMYISGTDLIINCNSVRTSSTTETISIRWEALK